MSDEQQARPDFLEQLEARRPVRVVVDVPEWGAPADGDESTRLYVRRLDVPDRLAVIDLFQVSAEGGTITDDQAAIEFGAELLARTIVDAEGNQVFDSERGRRYLASERPQLIQRLADEALDVNWLSEGADDDVKKK